MRVMSAVLAACLLVLAQCATPGADSLDIAELGDGEGYVITRVVTPPMRFDPDAIFGADFRLHFRRADSGPVNNLFSSTRVGEFIDVKSSEGAKLVALKLQGGSYVFHSVVVKLQENPCHVVFDALPGKITYIGDVAVDLSGTGWGPHANIARVVWNPDGLAEQVRRQYPGNPPLVERPARTR